MRRIIIVLICALLTLTLCNCADSPEAGTPEAPATDSQAPAALSPSVSAVANEPAAPGPASEPAATAAPSPSAGSPKPAPASPSPPPPSPSSPWIPEPQPVYDGVYTNYSYYTPNVPDRKTEIYSRVTEAELPMLIPSDSYGELLPYFIVENTDYYNWHNWEGLVTTDGIIVTDPVFLRIYSPQVPRNWWQSYGLQSISGPPLYILRLPETQWRGEFHDDYDDYRDRPGWMDYSLANMSVENIEIRDYEYRYNIEQTSDEQVYMVCASDGSWVTERYEHIRECDLTMLLIRDEFNNDADVMDYTGEILYNTKSFPFYDMLPVKSIDRYGSSLWPNGFWVNGNFMFRLIDGTVAFVNELTGECTIVAREDADDFARGLPPAAVTEYPPEPDPHYLRDGKVFRNDGTLLFETGGEVYYQPRQNVFVVIEKEEIVMGYYRETLYNYFSIYDWDGACVFRIALDKWRDD